MSDAFTKHAQGDKKIQIVGHDGQSNAHTKSSGTKRRGVADAARSDGEIRIKYMDSGKTQGMSLSKLETMGKNDSNQSLQVDFAMSSDGNWNNPVYEGILKLQVSGRKVSVNFQMASMHGSISNKHLILLCLEIKQVSRLHESWRYQHAEHWE